MSAEQTLEQAIDTAAQELLAKAEEGKTKPADQVDDKIPDDDAGDKLPDDDDKTPDDDDAAELAEAKLLLRTLKDKSQAPALIAALAQQVGILRPENLPQTSKETKVAAKSIAEQVIEGLGDEYKFMSPKLGAVIEQILEAKIAEVRSETQSHISEVQQTELVRETETVRAKLNKETNGNFDKLEPKMLKLMDDFLPSSNQSIESYLRGIYTIASNGTQRASAQKDLADKVRKNANDATSRLASAGRGGTSVEPARPAKPGIKHAVEFALRQLEQGQQK